MIRVWLPGGSISKPAAVGSPGSRDFVDASGPSATPYFPTKVPVENLPQRTSFRHHVGCTGGNFDSHQRSNAVPPTNVRLQRPCRSNLASSKYFSGDDRPHSSRNLCAHESRRFSRAPLCHVSSSANVNLHSNTPYPLPAVTAPLAPPLHSTPPARTPLVEYFEVAHCDSLSGHVPISGAKNSALAVLAGAICSQEPLVLRRVPDLADIRRMIQVLESVGVKVQRGVDGLRSSLLVDASCLTSVEPCPDTVRKLRASFFVFGAIMGRQGEAVVPLPGGCNIGARPIDLHVRGLQALGAEVSIRCGQGSRGLGAGGSRMGIQQL